MADGQNTIPAQIGHYKLVRELGRGSMGTVYLATQESLGREVALKLLGPEFTRDDEFLERFKREGRTAGKLRHPNIVQAFDLGESNGHYFIAMEYGGSQNLKQLLREHSDGFSIEQSIKFAKEILAALEHAHQRDIVHRDVKPANIIINEEGQALLTDFSVAHMKSASRLTQTGAAIGTPEYMAPEQFEGGPIDGRADLYAAGIILYEMLTGIQPFHGDTMAHVMKAQLFNLPTPPIQHNPNIPQALSDIVMKSLAKDANQRFPSSGAMLAALNQLEQQPQPAREATLEDFLASIASGKISLDEANAAREQVKMAIDQGYRKHLTIMMVDLAGSSKIKIPNQTLHADRAFRDYRASINAVLNGNSVRSFDWSGDGAICIFEEALPAVKAAAEIQNMVEDIASRHPSLPDKLRARIGINTGEVYLDPRRGLGEFASRTVDQAGHLEKDCPVGQVHVSEATMAACQRRFRFSEIGVNRDQIKVFQLDLPHALEVISGDTNKILKKAQPKFCPGCGKPIQAGRRICPECSYELGSLTNEPGFETTEIPSFSLNPGAGPTVPIPVVAAAETKQVVAHPPAFQQQPVAAAAATPTKTELASTSPVQSASQPTQEAVVPKEPPKIDLSSSGPMKGIQNAPKGFKTGETINEKPADRKESSPLAQSSGMEPLLILCHKVVALAGLFLFVISVVGAYLRGSVGESLWVMLSVTGMIGMPLMTFFSACFLGLNLIFVRKTTVIIQSGLIFLGLSLGTVVAMVALVYAS